MALPSTTAADLTGMTRERIIRGAAVAPIKWMPSTTGPSAGVLQLSGMAKTSAHTWGNVIRVALQQHPDVLFAGYFTPHPHLPEVQIKIQCKAGVDPLKVIAACHVQVEAQFDQLLNIFTRAVEENPPVGPVPKLAALAAEACPSREMEERKEDDLLDNLHTDSQNQFKQFSNGLRNVQLRVPRAPRRPHINLSSSSLSE